MAGIKVQNTVPGGGEYGKMAEIQLLSQDTIDKIAAGEVVERPSSVVKELLENAIDAKATAITVELKDGGISLIRVTDNGEGIEPAQIRTAFLRHATSKIRSVEDLISIGSLGFRGEALASICAVSQMELISRTAASVTGIRYRIEGSREQGFEEIGAPQGSTFLVRNLFYNTPARKKFLKTPATEAGYASDVVEHLALSHPEISFKLMINGQTKLYTSGNGHLKDVIYHIYGRDITSSLIPIDQEREGIRIGGFIAKPAVNRGNRNFETYFVNGRFVKSRILTGAIEKGYETFMMQHRYPFTVLMIEMDGSRLDVNVHPTKMELRFSDQAHVFTILQDAVRAALSGRELISRVSLDRADEQRAVQRQDISRARSEGKSVPEPFEKIRRELLAESKSPYQPRYSEESRSALAFEVSGPKSAQPVISGRRETDAKPGFSDTREADKDPGFSDVRKAPAKPALSNSNGTEAGAISGETGKAPAPSFPVCASSQNPASENQERPGNASETVISENLPASVAESSVPGRTEKEKEKTDLPGQSFSQMELFEEGFLARENRKEHKLIGQVFDTYWIVEFQNQMFIIDQHAAHEKVMYERLTANLENKTVFSQQLSPPVILTLSAREEEILDSYRDYFTGIGFTIEHFGGREYALSAAPADLPGIAEQEFFTQLLDALAEGSVKPSMDVLRIHLATAACKAAVKGNTRMSAAEADALIGELLKLENPYNCPHGRPTIIAISRYEMERKFKRIV